MDSDVATAVCQIHNPVMCRWTETIRPTVLALAPYEFRCALGRQAAFGGLIAED